MGKALKQVYRNEITIDNSVDLAKKEIDSIFNQKKFVLFVFKKNFLSCSKQSSFSCSEDVVIMFIA